MGLESEEVFAPTPDEQDGLDAGRADRDLVDRPMISDRLLSRMGLKHAGNLPQAPAEVFEVRQAGGKARLPSCAIHGITPRFSKFRILYSSFSKSARLLSASHLDERKIRRGR